MMGVSKTTPKGELSGRKMKAQRRLVNSLSFLCVLLMLVVLCPVQAADPSDHPHYLSLIIDATEKSGKTAETFGVEYTYRLNKR